MTVVAERKIEIFKEFGQDVKNTGSIEAQVALLTENIHSVSQHLRIHKKDFSSNRGLLKMVGQRKRLLRYLQRKNLNKYRELIAKLGLRK
ncbi:MAG: 30S ribosomal protein S15 [Chitinophagaceae bacterium]